MNNSSFYSTTKSKEEEIDKPKIMSNPLLSLFLVVALCVMTTFWYLGNQVPPLPAIKGYDWKNHPETLLAAYPQHDCGCGMGPRVIVEAGLTMGLDVIVISPSLSEHLKILKDASFPNAHFKLITDADPI